MAEPGRIDEWEPSAIYFLWDTVKLSKSGEAWRSSPQSSFPVILTCSMPGRLRGLGPRHYTLPPPPISPRVLKPFDILAPRGDRCRVPWAVRWDRFRFACVTSVTLVTCSAARSASTCLPWPDRTGLPCRRAAGPCPPRCRARPVTFQKHHHCRLIRCENQHQFARPEAGGKESWETGT